MSVRDDSNIFDFYSNLVSQEPDMTGLPGESTAGAVSLIAPGSAISSVHEGFTEWSSFDKFCKSLVHSIFQNLGPKGKEDLLERVRSCHSHEEIVSIADEEQIISITIDMLLQVSLKKYLIKLLYNYKLYSNNTLLTILLTGS